MEFNTRCKISCLSTTMNLFTKSEMDRAFFYLFQIECWAEISKDSIEDMRSLGGTFHMLRAFCSVSVDFRYQINSLLLKSPRRFVPSQSVFSRLFPSLFRYKTCSMGPKNVVTDPQVEVTEFKLEPDTELRFEVDEETVLLEVNLVLLIKHSCASLYGNQSCHIKSNQDSPGKGCG